MSGTSRAGTGRILRLIGRLALAGIFLFAAYAKMKPQGSVQWSVPAVKTSLLMFAMQVDSYQLLPPSTVSFVAKSLPLFELFLGLWLLSGIWLRLSSLLTTILLGGFFGVMVRTYAMGLEINCGCFGPGERLGPKSLLRDGSMLALALAVTIGAFLAARKKSSGAAASSPAELQQAP
ncbi:MAG: MauE/DoxX family redox-associated membrane protein [Candidatus Acidiferrales bacterium]